MYISYKYICASLVAQLVKNLPAMQDTWVQFLGQNQPRQGRPVSSQHASCTPRTGKFPWRRHRLPTPVSLGFPGGSGGKESAHNAGDLGLIPGLGRSPGRGHGNPLQYSCLENPQGPRSLAGCSPWGCKE